MTASRTQTLRVVVLGGTTVVLLAGGLILWARSGFAVPPQVFMSGPWALLALALSTVTQLSGGLLLSIRRPDNAIGWVILIFAAAISVTVFVDGYLALAGTGWSAPIEPSLLALLPGVISIPLGGFTAIVLGLTFPTGIPMARYRRVIAACAFGALLFSLGVVGTPGPIIWFPTFDNPIPVPGNTPLPLVLRYVVGPLVLIFGGAAASMALLERYRAADHIGRLQLRWYVTSAVLLTVGFMAFLVALYALPPDSPWGELITTGFFLAQGVPPVFMVVAISRYRLYDIDTIIGRAFVYGALTAILAGLYAASIRLFNALFVGLTGESSEATLVITTLILATTFTPIKARLEAFAATRMGDAREVPKTPEVAAVLDDPAFTAALDARIQVAIAEAAGRPADLVGISQPLEAPAEPAPLGNAPAAEGVPSGPDPAAEPEPQRGHDPSTQPEAPVGEAEP